uniref:Ymf39 n=1 Tax=Gracilaria firma TaxID=2510791 RepID=A0A1W6C6U5_9FLOR|nr:Ymf39 [Gracilaria changii]ARJ60478.1 Ymf39 [Gracilaria changii]ART65147.1 ymf39 [Gracilaria changii]
MLINFSIIFLLSLILISKNIILLNEEILILLCFITFCWLGFTKLKDSLNMDFKNQKDAIKVKFLESFKSIVNSLSTSLKWQKLFTLLITNFSVLEKHFKRLSLKTVQKLPLLQEQEIQKVYLKKLLFTKRLEQQTSKLISLLLIKKIERVTFLKYFYSTRVKIPVFQCNYKIILREYIETI